MDTNTISVISQFATIILSQIAQYINDAAVIYFREIIPPAKHPTVW